MPLTYTQLPPAILAMDGLASLGESQNFGLRFESVGSDEAAALETQFDSERRINQISADRLLSIGGLPAMRWSQPTP